MKKEKVSLGTSFPCYLVLALRVSDLSRLYSLVKSSTVATLLTALVWSISTRELEARNEEL